jgi:hypothetical protein
MADTGATSAGAGGEVSFGVTAWSNTSNVTASDNTYATCTLNFNADSRLIYGSNFGFAIPSGATINGIVFEIEWKATAGNVSVYLSKAYASKDVTSYFTAYGEATMSPTVPTSESYSSAGGSSNLWGTTWTPADINSANFGIGVSLVRALVAGSTTVSVDHIRSTVYYTDASGQPTTKRMGGVAFAHGGYQPGTGVRRWRHTQGGLILPNRSIIQPESRLAN